MIAKVTLSALAIALAAPAFAASQIELSAGVEPGVYTLAQVGEIASADEANDAARLKAFYVDADNTVSRADTSAPAVAERGGFSKGSDR